MNQLGRVFSVVSFGESHGPAVGCVIQGCPAGITLNWNDVQAQVNRRKTGKQPFASARQEDDVVQVLSGVYEGKTLGSPIALSIQN
ncbi:MAG: chorismate synthase, partial [Chitinophagaceae bacterium]|nr:chorismate synthase [Chitinophagaceae bacterium]